MKLKAHQIKFAKDYKGSNLIVHETGTGKTVCACVWLRDGRDSDAIVVCPKRVVEKWKDALNVWETKAFVVSMDQFKKLPILRYSAIVIDEADEFASPLFNKNRSQRSEALYNLVKAHPEVPILLLTATPIRSSPWNLHSLLTFSGHYIDWKQWRDVFFNLERRPYLSRPAYIPKPDWRKRIRPVLEKYADIVLLKDCIDDLPPIEEKIIKVVGDKFPGTKEVQPKAAFVEEHMWEQKNKHETILDIAKGYRKVLVVAYYREQIKILREELSKERVTYTVHGGVENQEAILKEANEVDECFLIVQASLGAGFDADSFSCVVFASMSYAVRDWIQMKGRVRRVHNLHPVVYNYLIAGRCDKAVKHNVDLGKDFSPSEWQK